MSKKKGEIEMKKKATASVIVALLLVTIGYYAVPTIAQEPIKIGIMGPMGLIQGDGMKEGAILAAENIGTILGRSIELVYADEFQGTSDGTAETGRLAMEFLMAAGCDFVIGGFRTESVAGAREVACDYEKIYLTTGAATDNLIACADGTCGACVRCDYERYKYVFRITPTNSTTLMSELTGIYYKFAYGFITDALAKLAKIYGTPVKYAVVVEDLTWTLGFQAVLGNMSFHSYKGLPDVYPYNAFGLADMYLGSPNSEGSSANPTAMWLVLNGSVPFVYPSIPAGNAKLVYLAKVSPTATDLDTELAALKTSGARLIIHILSAEKAGRAFINSWDALEVKAVPIGINVIDQMSEAWVDTVGAVEHETMLVTTGTKTPIRGTKSTDAWDAYVARWGRAPIYTAWGAMSAMETLALAIEAAGSIDNDDVIPQLEQTDRETATGFFKFTGPNPATDFDPATSGDQPYPYLTANPTMKGTLHDLYSSEYGSTWTEGYSRALVAQWQNERMEVVYPEDQTYSRKWKLPPRMGEVYVDDTLVYSVETDLNLDGEVDIFDVVTAATAFGAKPGDPTWNIEADIVVDGVIDIFDIVRIATAFGQSAPEWPLP